MKLSMRFGMAGVAGLAMLSAVQWLRGAHVHLGAAGAWLLGIAPNFAAAIAITFVLLAAWLDTAPATDAGALRRRFHASAAISATGLIAWEFLQMTSHALVFDWQDVLATLAGIAVCFGVFHAMRGAATDPAV